jgi:hypothetical protein
LPPDAVFCPRCRKPINDLEEEAVKSEEIVFLRGNQALMACDRQFIVRLSACSNGRAQGTWRMRDEVTRKFDLKVGEVTVWQTEYYHHVFRFRPGFGSQTAVGCFYQLKLLDESKDYDEVTFLVEKVGIFKAKS